MDGIDAAYTVLQVDVDEPELVKLVESGCGTPDPSSEKFNTSLTNSQEGNLFNEVQKLTINARESPLFEKSSKSRAFVFEGGRGYASYGPSRASSECSTPLSHAGIRSEKLEYPCLNFVQTGPVNLGPGGVPHNLAGEEQDPESGFTIKCHYNPVMDEYISLTNDEETNGKSVDEIIECIFELYKTDIPLNSSQKPSLNMGAFLAEFEEKGIMRDDPRLKAFMTSVDKELEEADEDNFDLLNLDRITFSRCLQNDFEFIHKVLRNQLVIPEFNDFIDIVESIFYECKDINEGKVATYIPQLAKYSEEFWGVSICTVDGQRFSLGDTDMEFSMQSVSKPFTYALGLNELGSEKMHNYVGQEPSGRMFNELSLDFDNKPHNPLLNSGAIMTAAILLKLVKPEMAISEKFDMVWNFFRRMAGDEYIGFNNSIFLSERETADRNFALAYYMKENKCFPEEFNLQETLDFYFQTCSMEVTCKSLAMMGATLANGGKCPINNEQVLQPEVVRDALSLMHSCGMYNYSGQFAFKVGLPAKSGVSGALVLVVPNVMGIGLWSPALDQLGNTVRGGQFAQKFSEKFQFHRFDLQTANKVDPRKHKYDVKKEFVMSLLYSATTGDLTALRRFKLQNYDFHQCDYDGRTALHLASAEGHLECVKFLLDDCGMNAEAIDRWGFTPIEEARRFKHEQVVKYFKVWEQQRLQRNLQTALSTIESEHE